MKKRRSIAEIGVYPPPYGGISVHVERLCDRLERNGLKYRIYDENGAKGPKNRAVVPIGPVEEWCRRYLFQKNEDIIHNHFLRWQVRFLLSLLRLKGKKVVHTVHSMREDGPRLGMIQRLLIRLTAMLSHHFVAVSDEVERKLLRLGVPRRKISVIPAFIPPPDDDDRTMLPTYIEQFAKRRARLIVANGGIGNEYDGVDLYGADLCVDMFSKIAEKNNEIGFIYAITHIVDSKQLERFKSLLTERGLADRFLFIEEKMPLYPLIRMASLFVRPTASDGDAISIREALYYGTPVVASDAVSRPEGVRLFENRNATAFAEACLDELQQKRDLSPYKAAQERYAEQLLRLLK